MNSLRKAVLGSVIVGASLTGGALGSYLLGGSAGAQTPTTTPTSAGATPAPAAGTDTSNNDATHEATESPQREADETAGKIGGGKHGPSNTDPAHEAAESPARAAAEAANDAALANGSTSSGG